MTSLHINEPPIFSRIVKLKASSIIPTVWHINCIELSELYIDTYTYNVCLSACVHTGILTCDVGCLDYYSPTLARGDCILQGVGQKLTTTVRVQHWQRKYFKLYPNRLEWADNYMVCTYVSVQPCLL